jgi:predicted dehydrogenase
MKIGIIGCGYVFDHYMATMDRHPELEIVGVADIDATRLAQACAYYDLTPVADVATLLADETIRIIVNLTSIEAHAEITRQALEAGKHVFSEKPFVTDMKVARDLADLAAQKGLRLSCAPSNALSATSQTMWKVVADGAVGDVRMVYAEFDDNPIYLMSPEGWRSRSGAPWPYLHEYEMGCTWEHVGYHLTWMCAIFGPVRQVTAFSKHTLPDKTDKPLNPPDTPDFSVACLDFESGVVGRVTCSIAAPYDHRMRIIGNGGMVHADTYRHYECPVYLEPFTKLTMNARKARTVRTNSFFQWLTGVGGRRVPLVGYGASAETGPQKKGSLLARFKRRQVGQQDKTIGISELAAAITEDRPHYPSADFTLHVTELTMAIQAAGPDGASHKMESRFDGPGMARHLRDSGPDYTAYAKPGWLARVSANLLDRMHRH